MTGVDATTTFLYFKWEALHEREKPYVLYMDVPGDIPNRNYIVEPGPPELVRDIRPNLDEFTLDRHGFAVRKQALSVSEFTPEIVESVYLPSLEQLLRQTLGADCKILWFDWRVCTLKFFQFLIENY